MTRLLAALLAVCLVGQSADQSTSVTHRPAPVQRIVNAAGVPVFRAPMPTRAVVEQFGVLGRGVSRGSAFYTYQLVAVGDSICRGNHLGPGGTDPGNPGINDYPTLIATDLPSGTSVLHNDCIGSTSIDNGGQGATSDSQFDGTKQRSVILIAFGANDIGGGESASVFVNSNLKPFAQARQTTGYKTVIVTILSECNGNNATRNSANTLIRGMTSVDGADAIADIGNNSTTMGADSACSDTSLYVDGIHPMPAGQALFIPTIEAAVRSLVTH